MYSTSKSPEYSHTFSYANFLVLVLRHQFDSLVIQIDNTWNDNASLFARFMSAFTLSITNQALLLNATWPNIALPNFANQANDFLISTSAEMVTYFPIVDDEDRSSWETFSALNKGWYEEVVKFQDPEAVVESILPFIHPAVVNRTHEEPIALPLWQTVPAPYAYTINFDMLELPIFNNAYQYVKATNRPVVSETSGPNGLSNAYDNDDGHPRSFLCAPLFNDFTPSKKLVGIFMSNVSWKNFFTSAAYLGIKGLVLVVANSCGDSFTYALGDEEPTFMGYGDLHDSKYEKYAQTTLFEAFQSEDENEIAGEYEGAEGVHNASSCRYYITVYPSEALVNSYNTAAPVYITVTVVLIFAVVSVLFVTYDRLVQARQVSKNI